jgi:hypothetical protein
LAGQPGRQVSQEDLLAWLTDYIARTRRMEERLAGWRQLVRPKGKGKL